MSRSLPEPGAGLWSDARFPLLLTARGTSFLGTAAAPIGIAFAVLQATGSTADLGLVLGAGTLPMLLLLFGGLAADRYRRDRVVLAGDACGFSGQAVTASLVLAGHPPIALLAALQALVGVGIALRAPTVLGLVAELVEPADLRRANGAMTVAQQLATVLGAPLGGVVAALVNPGWSLALDALIYGIACGCWIILGRRVTLAPLARAGRSARSDLSAGWREVRSRRWMWVIIVQFSVLVCLGVASFDVLGPAQAQSRLGGAGAFGVVLAAESAGAVAGAFLASRWRPQRPMLVGTIAMLGVPLELVGLAEVTTLAVVAALAGLAGLGFSAFDVFWSTELQQSVPAERLGTVSALDGLGSNGLLPLGAALMGGLASVVGISNGLLIGAAGALVPTLAVLFVSDVRRMGLQSYAAEQKLRLAGRSACPGDPVRADADLLPTG